MKRRQKRDQLIENLDAFRNERGYSGTEFARILGVRRQQWDRWKNGIKRNGTKKFYGMTLKSAHGIITTINKYFDHTWTLADWIQDTPPKLEEANDAIWPSRR